MTTLYSYQAEKLSMARRVLMLPTPGQEAERIAEAFHNCSLAFHRFDDSTLDDNARGWKRVIERTMDTSGIKDESGVGTWSIRAAQLTDDQRRELANAIDELAHWFDREFWGRTR